MSKPCILNVKTGALFGNLFEGAGQHELTLLRRLKFTNLDLLTKGSIYVNDRGKATYNFLWNYWEIPSWTDLWGANGLVFNKAKILTEWSVEQAIEGIKEIISRRETSKLFHAASDGTHDHMLLIINETLAALVKLLRKKKNSQFYFM